MYDERHFGEIILPCEKILPTRSLGNHLERTQTVRDILETVYTSSSLDTQMTDSLEKSDIFRDYLHHSKYIQRLPILL